jgi:hypothetical protein
MMEKGSLTNARDGCVPEQETCVVSNMPKIVIFFPTLFVLHGRGHFRSGLHGLWAQGQA